MQQTCLNPWCKQPFTVTDADVKFLEDASPIFNGKKELIPSPTLCPACRYQNRLRWRNERNLFKTKCAATGKQIVAIYSPDKSWPPVYEQKYWWSDAWDPRSYGREFDFSRPFFEQFAELYKVVPQIAMNNQGSENCEFTNQSQNNKDCYLIFCSDRCRDCLHGMWNGFCVNCCDCQYLEKGELCYEVLNGKNCYGCTFSQNLENCSSVHFSRNCIGCESCFGCVNLRNKKYFIWNKEHTEEDYERKLKEFGLDRRSACAENTKLAAEFFKAFPHKYYEGNNIFDSVGNYMIGVQDAQDCYNCRDSEHVHHCQDAWYARNCQDLTETAYNDFSYSIEGSGHSVQVAFSKKFDDLGNALFCSHCNYSKNLFGCISLNHGSYCILNKQYTKEEYEALVPKIIDHMRTPLRSSGASHSAPSATRDESQECEWGNHFPGQYSPFGYNETVAQEYFPMTEAEVKSRGWQWSEYEAPQQASERTIPASQLPDSIDDIPDDVLNWAIKCAVTGKSFRIIKQELDFYRRVRVPLPHLHPDERFRRRMALRTPRKLWDRECMKCKKGIRTGYAPERSAVRGSEEPSGSRGEIVYCESCYLACVN